MWKKRVTKNQPEIFDLLVILPYRKNTWFFVRLFPDQSHLQAELFKLGLNRHSVRVIKLVDHCYANKQDWRLVLSIQLCHCPFMNLHNSERHKEYVGNNSDCSRLGYQNIRKALLQWYVTLHTALRNRIIVNFQHKSSWTFLQPYRDPT